MNRGLRPWFLLCLLRRRNLRLKLPFMVVASVPPVPGGCVRSRLTDILFVFLVRVLIAILIIVARRPGVVGG